VAAVDEPLGNLQVLLVLVGMVKALGVDAGDDAQADPHDDDRE
jgi:hypothetical protein